MALRQLGWDGQTILSAGRTDTGTHALGQVIAFDLAWQHPCDALRQALNAHLPVDIAVQDVTIAPEGFHPRYDARARRYRYQVYCQAVRYPLLERYAWRLWPAPEIDRMNEAAALLVGEHNFTAFGTPPRPGGSTRRKIYQAGWSLEPYGMHFDILANAFLYHMVRRVVYIQVQIGLGRVPLDDFRLGLADLKAQMPGLAPAHGLSLEEVLY